MECLCNGVHHAAFCGRAVDQDCDLAIVAGISTIGERGAIPRRILTQRWQIDAIKMPGWHRSGWRCGSEEDCSSDSRNENERDAREHKDNTAPKHGKPFLR